MRFEASRMTSGGKENSMKNQIVVGHIALIQRPKRQDFVLEVLVELKKRGYEVIGLFAGEVRDEQFCQELKEKVKAHGLENSVVFLGRRNDIPDFLKFLDVLMIPSVEGFPLAGLEAASAGIPVVACNVAGAEEFIEVSGDGMTFKEDDAMDAATCIEKIVSNRDEMVEIGQLFANNSSMESYAERLERLFQEVG